MELTRLLIAQHHRTEFEQRCGPKVARLLNQRFFYEFRLFAVKWIFASENHVFPALEPASNQLGFAFGTRLVLRLRHLKNRDC